ncbi:MAG: hypothetical protein AAFR82_00785, partial [Pseudomonadota bacterium]
MMRLLPLIIGVIFLAGCWPQGSSEDPSVIPRGYSVTHAELRELFLRDHAPKHWRKGAIAMQKTYFALVCFKNADGKVGVIPLQLEWLKSGLESMQTAAETKEDEAIYHQFVLRFNSIEPIMLEELSAEKTKRETWRATYQKFFREMQSLDKKKWVKESLLTEALDPNFKPYDNLYWRRFNRAIEARRNDIDRSYRDPLKTYYQAPDPEYMCGRTETYENWEEVRRI